MAGLNQEIWTDVLVQQFRATEEASFLNLIPDESRLVSGTRGENEVIHLVDIGADPSVITNNITYPIGVETQTDGDIAISLDTHVTKATKVTQEDVENIVYDKIRLVQEKHKHAIMVRKHDKAVHALAPVSNKTETPVLVTTGSDDGTGRKRLIMRDLITLKSAWDAQKIPLADRVLVLTAEHYNDLLIEALEAKKTTDHLSYDEAGMLKTMLFGFKVFMYISMPYFKLSTKAKLSFGATPVVGDVQASVAFVARDMFRASGLTKNYVDEPDTQTHSWMYNVRHNYVVLPKKERAIAAIISDNA